MAPWLLLLIDFPFLKVLLFFLSGHGWPNIFPEDNLSILQRAVELH